jgi:hypothetical protein
MICDASQIVAPGKVDPAAAPATAIGSVSRRLRARFGRDMEVGRCAEGPHLAGEGSTPPQVGRLSAERSTPPGLRPRMRPSQTYGRE